MNTRRDFVKVLAGIGLFSILPGAGRIWKAEKKVIVDRLYFDDGIYYMDIECNVDHGSGDSRSMTVYCNGRAVYEMRQERHPMRFEIPNGKYKIVPT